MGIRQVTSCDVCGADKKQTNHWWKVKEINGHLVIYKSDVNVPRPRMDVCGQAHLHTLVDRWMEIGTLEKQEDKP